MAFDDDTEVWDEDDKITVSKEETSEDELDRLRREAYRSVRAVDRMRISASYRLGRLFTDSVFSPFKLILLPFRTLSLVWTVGLERLGRREPPELHSNLEYTLSESAARSILFFPTNGTGLGHFTRLFAIARRIKRADPTIQLIFFTTCSTTHLLQLAGIPAYHLPERKRIPNMTAEQWNLMAEESLSTVMEMHNPSMFVFDGVFPYRGILHAIHPRKEMHKLWVRRGNFRKELNFPAETMNHFNYIIHPKDSIEEKISYSKSKVDVLECDPIVFADYNDLHPKELLKEKLGIPEDCLVVYVQLGAGKINNIMGELETVISVLSEYENIYTIVGQSILGEKINFRGPRVRVIREYPNSLYFKSFDFAVVAGGYNTYNEVVKFGLPSICFPNMKTGRDNQLARVMVAAEVGGIEIITSPDKSKFRESVERLLDSDIRSQMSKSLSELARPNGANQIALRLVNMLGRDIEEIPPSTYGDFDSNVEPFWEIVRSTPTSKINHEWGDREDKAQKVDFSKGIFTLKKSEQPRLIIDTTNSLGEIHTTLTSPIIEIEKQKRNSQIFSCDVILKENLIPEVKISSVVVLNYYNKKGKKVAQQKIRSKLNLDDKTRINELITPPSSATSFACSIVINRSMSCRFEYSNFEIDIAKKPSENIKKIIDKENSVSMFVFNSFENDTRVYREAKSLISVGYDVKIYAIKKSHTPKREMLDGIEIIRVPLLPFHLKLIRASRKVYFLPLIMSIIFYPISLSFKIIKLILKPLNGFFNWIIYSLLFRNKIPSKIKSKSFRKKNANLLDKSTRKFCEWASRKIFMPFHRYIQFYYFDKEVLKLVKSEPSKIYHAHDLNTLRVASKAAKIHKSKLVYDSHELYVDRNRSKPASKLKKFMLRRFERKLIRKTDFSITVNDSIAELLAMRYKVKKPVVVMNTPPKQDIMSKMDREKNLRVILNIDANHTLALYTGAITYNRGIEKLIESLSYIDDVHLVLMGYGTDEYLHKLYTIADELNVTNRYSKFGPVPSEDVPTYASSADLGIAPIQNSCLSYYLCSPNKVFEYIQAGLPVIASNFPELRKIVLGKDIGDVFDPENAEDIALTIRKLMSDKDKLSKIRDNCNLVVEEYNWENESSKLKNAYELILPIDKGNIRIKDITNLENKLALSQLSK